MNFTNYWGKSVQFITFDHARFALEVRGILAESDLGKDFVKLLPWDESHSLAKVGPSVTIPLHVMVSMITGVWELENYGKNTKANVTNPVQETGTLGKSTGTGN